MKNPTLFLMVVILGVIYYFVMNIIYDTTENKVIDLQIQNAKEQATTISKLLSTKMMLGYSDKELVKELQSSIEGLPTDGSFICLFNKEGIEVCHPNKNKIGQVITKANSLVELSLDNNKITKSFRESILSFQSLGGVRSMPNRTEVVYLSPVAETEYLVASHYNLKSLTESFVVLKERLLYLFLIVWLVSVIFIYFFTQLYYKKSFESLNEINIQTFKAFLGESTSVKPSDEAAQVKTRLLVQKGNKLVPIEINDVAYVFTENTLNYVVTSDGSKYHESLTLEELTSHLPSQQFFRANRQVILSINCIQSITRYGQSQLKVLVNPKYEKDIIISKSKAKLFKEWAGQNTLNL